MRHDAPGDVAQRAGERARDIAQDGVQGVESIWNYAFPKIAGMEITVGNLVVALVTLLLTWIVSILVRGSIARYAKRNPNANSASLYTVTRLAQYMVLLVGALIALSVVGVSLNKFAVLAGALGVGLGFGLQAIFSNFVSGLILLFDRSLKVGDFVELSADLRGTVRAIDIRSTRITTNDNIDVIVPNSEFVTQRVVNWTHGSVNRRIRVEFGVAYGVDKELVKKAALEAASNVPFTLSMDGPRAPQVWLVGFGESSVDFILAVWLTEQAARRNAAIKAAYLWELDTALKKYEIEIPFPQRDLHLRSAFGMQGRQALEALRALELHGDDQAPPVRRERGVALDDRERAELSRNDAQEDTERQIEEDAQRESEDKAREAEQGNATQAR